MDYLGNVLETSFRNVWSGVADFIPNLISAVIVFIVGAIVGGLVGKLVAHLVRAAKIDSLLRRANVEEYFVKAGLRLDVGKFIGILVQWFIVIVFLLAALEIVGLSQVTDFLKSDVLSYLSKVIVAVFILIAAVLIGEAMQRVVVHSAKAAELKSANLLGVATRWAIWIFAIIAALHQLNIATAIVQTAFTGLVIALALGVGLSFGLGGQAAAAEFIAKIRQDISDRRHG